MMTIYYEYEIVYKYIYIYIYIYRQHMIKLSICAICNMPIAINSYAKMKEN